MPRSKFSNPGSGRTWPTSWHFARKKNWCRRDSSTQHRQLHRKNCEGRNVRWRRQGPSGSWALMSLGNAPCTSHSNGSSSHIVRNKGVGQPQPKVPGPSSFLGHSPQLPPIGVQPAVPLGDFVVGESSRPEMPLDAAFPALLPMLRQHNFWLQYRYIGKFAEVG